MLSTDQLASMRSTLNVSLPDTAQIKRAAPVSDGEGGQTVTWNTIATVAARLSPEIRRMADENELGGEVASAQNWIVTLPAATDINAKDRVLIGGRTFNVLEDDGPRSYEIARRVRCREIT